MILGVDKTLREFKAQPEKGEAWQEPRGAQMLGCSTQREAEAPL